MIMLIHKSRVGRGKGKSYAGKNPFGKYCTCAEDDLVHYLRYIRYVKIVDVLNL